MSTRDWFIHEIEAALYDTREITYGIERATEITRLLEKWGDVVFEDEPLEPNEH